MLNGAVSRTALVSWTSRKTSVAAASLRKRLYRAEIYACDGFRLSNLSMLSQAGSVLFLGNHGRPTERTIILLIFVAVRNLNHI